MPPPPPPTEPCVRRIVVPAFRRAVVDIWGDEGRDRMLALLRGDDLEEFVRDNAQKLDWFPARHVIAWAFAAWEGPAGRSRDAMTRFIRHQWDLSFGVIRRLLLHMANPAPIVPRLPQLWKQDNSAGEVEATLDETGSGARIYISNSPFVETPHSRTSMAEIYRHAFSQTRAKNVTEAHALDGARRMVIRLRWTM